MAPIMFTVCAYGECGARDHRVGVETPAVLDVSAAWVADKSALTVAVVNPTDQPASTALAIKGAQLTGEGMAWVIAGTSRAGVKMESPAKSGG